MPSKQLTEHSSDQKNLKTRILEATRERKVGKSSYCISDGVFLSSSPPPLLSFSHIFLCTFPSCCCCCRVSFVGYFSPLFFHRFFSFWLSTHIYIRTHIYAVMHALGETLIAQVLVVSIRLVGGWEKCLWGRSLFFLVCLCHEP